MTKQQETDFTIMDQQEWSETEYKINQIKDILKEEGLDKDPDIMSAFDDAVQHAVKGEIIEEGL